MQSCGHWGWWQGHFRLVVQGHTVSLQQQPHQHTLGPVGHTPPAIHGDTAYRW